MMRLAAGRSVGGPFRILDLAVDIVLCVTLLLDVFAVFANVVTRVFFQYSFLGIEEVTEVALGTLAFIGAAACYRVGGHMPIKFLVDRMPAAWASAAAALVDGLVFALSATLSMLSVSVLIRHWSLRTPLLGMPETWNVLPLALGMLLLAVYSARNLTGYRPSTIGVMLTLLAALFTIALVLLGLLRALGVESPTHQGTWIAVVFAVVLLLLSAPIGFALAIAALAFVYVSGVAPPAAVLENMRNGVSSFILIAVPFFIAAGLIMTEGLTAELGAFVRAWIGHFRAGLLQVVVVTMYLFSGISGSKVADVSAVGSALGRMLREHGYERGEIVAVLSASAAMGETIPPSIAVLVLASITSLSVGALFIAGILPAAVLAVCLMMMLYVRALLAREPREPRVGWKQRGLATVRALPALLLPILLVGGILGGIGTPTEVSSFAVVYGIVVGVLVYRILDRVLFWRVIRNTACMSGMVLFILSAAHAFSWSLTVSNVPHAIGDLVGRHGSSALGFMLASMVVLIVMGAALEALPALIIFGPLLLPLAEKLGIHPLHYAIVLLIAMGIGTVVPYIGIVLYAACMVGKASMEESSRRLLPYLAMLLVGLLVVAFAPWFTLTVPRFFGMTN